VAVALGEGELDRILTNLVGNAARHAREVGLAASQLEDRVVITVTDDGPGIPAADRERVFERFTRLTRRGTGTREAPGSGSPS
jgi:signal transduction histidine kinase